MLKKYMIIKKRAKKFRKKVTFSHLSFIYTNIQNINSIRMLSRKAYGLEAGAVLKSNKYSMPLNCSEILIYL